MRILLFSSTYRPLIGGVETVTHRLAQELHARGHDVLVMTNRYPMSLMRSELLDDISVARRRYPNLVPSPGRRPWRAIGKQILSIPLAAYEIAYLVRVVRATHPDVVNIHYLSYPSAYALVAAGITKTPVVLSFHGSDVPSSPYPANYRWFGRRACRLAHGIACNSQDLAGYLRDGIRSQDRSKIEVISFGIDDQPPSPESTVPQAPFILVAARLVEKKGVAMAIRAMSELHKDGVSARLVIVGGGPVETILKAMAVELGVSEFVEFVGEATPERLAAYMRDCLFVVVPSRWEAFGVIALEAMMTGKAVVATRSGGIEEIVVHENTGLLVSSTSPRDLAESIRVLLENPDRARQMGEQGRNRAMSEFDWASVATKYEESFRRVTGSRVATGER